MVESIQNWVGFFIYEYDYRGNRVRQEEVGSQDPTVYLWDEFSRFGDVILETGVNFSDSSLYHKMDYTVLATFYIRAVFEGKMSYEALL